MIPHGISVIVTAPAAFEFTFEADPERHQRAAELLGGTDLPDTLRALMDDLKVPSLSELGYTRDDVPALVDGAMAQERLLAVAPRDVSAQDVAKILQSVL